MTQSIRKFVETCNVCNSRKKANRNAKCPLTKYHSGAPMVRVHLDFFGPLPETTQGNAHILVMVDKFSKLLECISLPTQTAEQSARAAVNDLCSPVSVFLFKFIQTKVVTLKADYLNQYVMSYKFTRQELHRTDRRPMVKLSVVTGH